MEKNAGVATGCVRVAKRVVEYKNVERRAREKSERERLLGEYRAATSHRIEHSRPYHDKHLAA